jgi:hypothetical protein
MAAAQWYENQYAGLGGQFLDQLLDTITLIERHPRRFGKARQRSSRELRRAMLSRFPYAVVYEVRERECLIIAIARPPAPRVLARPAEVGWGYKQVGIFKLQDRIAPLATPRVSVEVSSFLG